MVEVGITTYQSKIRPILEYASPVWAGLPNYLQHEIERVQSLTNPWPGKRLPAIVE